MGAFAGLSAFFDGKIVDYAVRYLYDESNIMILKGDKKGSSGIPVGKIRGRNTR